MNVNKCFIGGHLTRSPELKYTPKGTPVARVSIAVNRTWKMEAGEKKEEVSFVDCDAFGKTAETMTQHLRKGSGVFVEGRLKLHSWEKDGEKQYQLKVVIESFQFVGSKKGDASRVTESGAVTPAQSQEEDDDVPL